MIVQYLGQLGPHGLKGYVLFGLNDARNPAGILFREKALGNNNKQNDHWSPP